MRTASGIGAEAGVSLLTVGSSDVVDREVLIRPATEAATGAQSVVNGIVTSLTQHIPNDVEVATAAEEVHWRRIGNAARLPRTAAPGTRPATSGVTKEG